MNLVSYVNLVINIPFLGGIICQPKIMLVSLTLCYSNLLTFSPNYHNFPQITQKTYIKFLEPGCVKQKLKKIAQALLFILVTLRQSAVHMLQSISECTTRRLAQKVAFLLSLVMEIEG